MSFGRRAVDKIRSLATRVRSDDRTVAIACQGGGSHAAFTGGVLAGLFEELPPDVRIVGISGASGGAVSATAAWYGRAAAEVTPATVLESVWNEIAATSGWDAWVNELTLLTATIPESVPRVTTTPYANPYSEWGANQLETTLTEHVDFDAFGTLASDPDAPALLVSAVNVRSGEPVVFRDERVTADAVVASSAIPRVFEAVEIDGEHYWDGFLSQNPPIREFVTDETIPPVDELWVIRLTPKARSSLPTSPDEISERVQQLVENNSLSHELRFVEQVNEWIDAGTLRGPNLTETTVRTIDLDPDGTDGSRLNRRSSFISELFADGRTEAERFLEERT